MNAPSCFKPTQAAIDAIPAMYRALRTLADRKTLERYDDLEIRAMVAEVAAAALEEAEDK